jgi:hypothetical protein
MHISALHRACPLCLHVALGDSAMSGRAAAAADQTSSRPSELWLAELSCA